MCYFSLFVVVTNIYTYMWYAPVENNGRNETTESDQKSNDMAFEAGDNGWDESKEEIDGRTTPKSERYLAHM